MDPILDYPELHCPKMIDGNTQVEQSADFGNRTFSLHIKRIPVRLLSLILINGYFIAFFAFIVHQYAGLPRSLQRDRVNCDLGFATSLHQTLIVRHVSNIQSNPHK